MSEICHPPEWRRELGLPNRLRRGAGGFPAFWIAPIQANYVYFAAGFDAEPWTMRSLSTLKTPGAELACMPAMDLSISLLTTP